MKPKLSYSLVSIALIVFTGMAVISYGKMVHGGATSVTTSVAPRLTSTPSSTPPQSPALPPPAPFALDASKIGSRMDQVLKISNIAVQSINPIINVRLTPVAPRHASGAEIKKAGPLSEFLGVSNSTPDGSYTLTKFYISSVDLHIP